MVPGGNLTGHSVVVTGASSGIGRATALELADRGAHVTAVARREDALATLSADARGRRGTLRTVAADVTDAAAMVAVADDAAAQGGGLNAWINNAAVNLYGPIDGPPVADQHRVIATNVGGYLNGIRAALPHLREAGSGVIVNVSSVLGFVPGPYQAAYAASKHAIHGLTTSVRAELRRDGIRVCEVAPGPVDTPLFRQAGNHMGRVVVPPDPIVTPERVTRAILAALVRPKATRIVGVQQRMTVAAGRVAPRLTERLARRLTAQVHFSDAPVPALPGNLHEPGDVPATIDGGWRTAGRAAVVAAAVSAAAALVHVRERSEVSSP
jgi:short-subunit dehydrogenase